MIDYHRGPAARLTELGGVDVMLDHVGGPWLPMLLAALAPRGRLVAIARLAGNVGDCDLDLFRQARAQRP